MSRKFQQKLQEGKGKEAEIDEALSNDFVISPLSLEQEKLGNGDRVFVRRDNNKAYLIEYKTDERAAATGSLFVETISVDTGKAGWAYTCNADFLFFYIPEQLRIIIVRPEDIRKHLKSWGYKYRIAPSSRDLNDGYISYGILVPIEIVREIGVKVIAIDDVDRVTIQDFTDRIVEEIAASGWA